MQHATSTKSEGKTNEMDRQTLRRLSGGGREFVCGMGSATINIMVTFPVNKIIFRQQLSGIGSYAAVKQLQSEGLSRLYRGVFPPLLQKSVSVSVMFGMYEQFNRIFSQDSRRPTIQVQFASAFLTGCIEAILTPFERVQTLLQDKYYHQKYRNTLHAFRELRRYGAFEYYRGLTPILMRNGPSNVLFFQLRGKIKSLMPNTDKKAVDTFQNFVSGGVLGAAISTLFYPVNVTKAHMQASVGGKFPGFYASFLVIFKERNYSVHSMFRGFQINFTRSLISWGIINASYEILKNWYSFYLD